jgi:DNA-binding NarL/FixJ family response regulator
MVPAMSQGERMAAVVAFVDDLFFQARLLETARQVGVELRAVSTAEALAEGLREQPALVLVDLNARTDAVKAIETLRATGNAAAVIGFFSHVQSELAERALAAGCREVMPRSRFTRNLAAILSAARS